MGVVQRMELPYLGRHRWLAPQDVQADAVASACMGVDSPAVGGVLVGFNVVREEICYPV